ncbi:MAG TPA: efflux transporter outer membrane subunit [Chthoniobacteraceae bacterium]|nr:efflux transporter outer membrane subunit [Chthoniobacteraceae bacterium]
MQVRLLKVTTLLTTTLLAAGCAVGPNYLRPDIDAPASYRDQKETPTPESLADLPWWKVFRDPALQSLIREGLENNYDLRIAITRIEQARAEQVQVRSAFFPQLGYNAAAQRGKSPGQRIPASSTPSSTLDVNGTSITIPGRSTPETDVTGRTTNTFQAQGMLSWELDVWGRIRRSNEAALARLLRSEDFRRGVVQSLVAEIATGYFDLLELDAELQIAKDARDSFGQSLDLFTKQQTGGIASDLEVARASAAQASAAAAIPEVERMIRITENRISNLLGRNPGPVKRGKGLLAQKMPPRIPSGIPSTLLERRPDLRQAEQDVIAANAEIGVAVADFLPTVDLTAAAGAVSPALGELVNGKWGVWNIGSTISGPIFTGGLLKGRYEAAKARREEAALAYQRTATNAFREVSDALISRKKYDQTKVELERQVSALRRSVSLASDRYTIGISTYYEILEAQQQLFPAERTLMQTRRNQLLSIVDLYRALGGGWSEVVDVDKATVKTKKSE